MFERILNLSLHQRELFVSLRNQLVRIFGFVGEIEVGQSQICELRYTLQQHTNISLRGCSYIVYSISLLLGCWRINLVQRQKSVKKSCVKRQIIKAISRVIFIHPKISSFVKPESTFFSISFELCSEISTLTYSGKCLKSFSCFFFLSTMNFISRTKSTNSKPQTNPLTLLINNSVLSYLIFPFRLVASNLLTHFLKCVEQKFVN